MVKRLICYVLAISRGSKLRWGVDAAVSIISSMGKNVLIERGVAIQGAVSIFDNVYINRGCWLNGEIVIGANSKLGPRVMIWTDSHEYAAAKLIRDQGVSLGRVKIGEDCWVGANVTIIGSVEIGDGAVVGAGSVVTKDVGRYQVWAGNPARFIKSRG